MSTPDVRIGIVTYDTPADLEACLQTLSAAVEGLDAEVVVVDNGSELDADAEVARRFAVRLLRLERNVGYPRAMNTALAEATAPVLVALNPDTVLEPGSLTRLVGTLLADPTTGLVGPRITSRDGHLNHSVRAFPSPAGALTTGFAPRWLRRRLRNAWWLDERPEPTHAVDADWLVGALHVLRREAVRRDRVYSERSFMYAEDMELCWHVRAGGWRVVHEPTVTISHVGEGTGARAYGGSRERRWLDASYDWYVAVHGEAAARRWAVANVAGLAMKSAVLGVVGTPEHRSFVHELLGFHARRMTQPLGDLHSRLTVAGEVPPAPVVCFDSAHDGAGAGSGEQV